MTAPHTAELIQLTRVCTKCGQEKSLDKFRFYLSNKRRWSCRGCDASRNALIKREKTKQKHLKFGRPINRPEFSNEVDYLSRYGEGS